MRVGILGSGLTGGKLGTLLARAGHEVVFSYAHSQDKLAGLARTAGRDARAAPRVRPHGDHFRGRRSFSGAAWSWAREDDRSR